ncbi:MAG: hypothetical protein JXB47_17900 [Anaerolineae bacterium]|nr:hypothetical protein [Anaerolineae bacterium]
MTIIDRKMADMLSETPKIISEDVVWKSMRGGRYRLKVPVLAIKINEVLELWGNVGVTNYGFSLAFQNITIRRYDNNPKHPLPSGEVLTVPHKHIWDEINESAEAYIPQDIDPNADINDQLLQFIEEENIRLIGEYEHVMFFGGK